MTRLQKVPTIDQGQAGVHRVLSELILRGHRTYTPSADTGVDILLESGVRIQVKTTMRASAHHRLVEGTFLFTLGQADRIIKSQVVNLPGREFSKHCDFIVLWAIEPDRFWVVPAGVLDGRHTVTISPVKQWRDFDKDRVDTLKASGLTLAEIAKELGVSVKTVMRRQTTLQAPKREYTEMPKYENRWDLITASVATMCEAVTIASTSREEAVTSSPDTPAARR